MKPVLKVEQLSVNKTQAILNRVSFEVSAEEILLVLGPSGAGKSTLLRCLNRLDPVDSGTVSLKGVPTDSIDMQELRRRVGMVFQIPALIPYSVKANILLGPALRKEMLSDADCESLLSRVGLNTDYLHRQVETLSVGEQQRVQFAQVLANRPEVLLLDEPTSALDPSAVSTIEQLIRTVHHDLKTATVLVTHNLEQALRFGTKTLVLMEGSIVAEGNIRDLVNSPATEKLKQFFEGRLHSNS